MTNRVNELSTLLFKERECLELLHFKLEEQNLLLIAGKTQWLSAATREIEHVLERMHHTSLERTLVAREVAESWGGDPDSSLSELAALAPVGPWGEILTSHLTAIHEYTNVIAATRDANEQFLRAAQRSAQETLANLGDSASTYGRSGAADVPGTDARILDTNV
ncbi:flagellar protein FlgN [Glutamicibacter soli]|uniref:Flagellar protein FlgN n=1 Tax=Glutamicibacter soli TaxID=453836 RepID=A0A365YBM7_9MICC|nr:MULTISPECIES: flagellar protein FlgN [Micrococcaceae]ALD63655.1 hypothetical protein AFL94_06610 [Arthrobacter sp. LS16]ALQ31100.1 hypothetical protein ATC04_11370 [Arthrobacter sp. YC-RL1]KLI87634.1 hypothetical protein AA310_06520 [Arthrobacter sp. YC-RL1]NAZ16720.1 flagellar protein FlgN [Glutamicibacter soli]RBL99729.1 flagellar protein FlgN [Glutamicibacter soli]